MTNAQRGEVILTMGDRQISGRMTLDTLMRIESSLGMSIVKAMRLVADGDLTTAQIIGILLPIVKAGDEHLDESELKKIIWERESERERKLSERSQEFSCRHCRQGTLGETIWRTKLRSSRLSTLAGFHGDRPR